MFLLGLLRSNMDVAIYHTCTQFIMTSDVITVEHVSYLSLVGLGLWEGSANFLLVFVVTFI